MSTYRINSGRHRWPQLSKYQIHYGHRWSLPGVICDQCGQTWATSGYEYPDVDLSTFSMQTSMLEAKAVPLAEYQLLHRALDEYLGCDLTIAPGAGFGPAKGPVEHSPPPEADFLWILSWTLFLAPNTYHLMVEHGVKMPSYVETHLPFKALPQNRLTVWELAIRPASVCLPDRVFVRRPDLDCDHCGYRGRSLPTDSPPFGGVELEPGVDICRASNWPTWILVSENFRDVVERLGLNCIEFHQL